MKKYVFFPQTALFNPPLQAPYSEVEHKILAEECIKYRVIVIAGDIKEAFEKAKKDMSDLIGVNYGNMKSIQYYSFPLKVLSVEELK